MRYQNIHCNSHKKLIACKTPSNPNPFESPLAHMFCSAPNLATIQNCNTETPQFLTSSYESQWGKPHMQWDQAHMLWDKPHAAKTSQQRVLMSHHLGLVQARASNVVQELGGNLFVIHICSLHIDQQCLLVRHIRFE